MIFVYLTLFIIYGALTLFTFYEIDNNDTISPELTMKRAWWAFLWPLRLFMFIIVAISIGLHEILCFMLIMFGIKYKGSKVYKLINDFLKKYYDRGTT